MPLTVKLQNVGVVLPQAAAVADRHQRDAQGLGVVVHDLFRLERDAARALVEDGVLGAVVEEARHGDALLQAAREHVAPLSFGVPPFVIQVHEVRQVERLEDGEEVGVGGAALAHLAQRVWVDDLLAQRAAREVRPLRQVKDGGKGRLVHGAAVDGPQTAEDAEERRLAAAVGADDEEMVAVLDGKGQGLDENVAVGRDNGAARVSNCVA